MIGISAGTLISIIFFYPLLLLFLFIRYLWYTAVPQLATGGNGIKKEGVTVTLHPVLIQHPTPIFLYNCHMTVSNSF